MGMLVNGHWEVGARQPDPAGRFVRTPAAFRERVSAEAGAHFPAESGRYHLYVSLACPWAHRTLIVRRLKGLEEAVSVSVVAPHMGEMGWAFGDGPGCTPDPVLGARYLHELYRAAAPGFTGRCSVPLLWDTVRARAVNNESADIVRMFGTAFVQAGVASAEPDFCPPHLRARIDETIEALYEPINNGVYKTGFASTQRAYDEAAGALFAALAHWEGVLGRRRYLCGNSLTEADWFLFTTLLRFDAVYHYHFKCNVARIRDLPNLWNYLKALYQMPGVAETCDMDHIKQHYYRSHPQVNPSGVVPAGPLLDLSGPHDRGRAFPEG